MLSSQRPESYFSKPSGTYNSIQLTFVAVQKIALGCESGGNPFRKGVNEDECLLKRMEKNANFFFRNGAFTGILSLLFAMLTDMAIFFSFGIFLSEIMVVLNGETILRVSSRELTEGLPFLFDGKIFPLIPNFGFIVAIKTVAHL